MAILGLLQNVATQISSLGLTALTSSFILLGFLIHYSVLDPLRKVPGPLICRLTPFWTWYHAYIGDECRMIDSLFQKYGPVVRVAPNEVVISDGAALSPIYSEKGGFLKAPCYSNFDFEGHSTIFSALDPAHRHVRSKAVLPLFSIGSIRSRMDDIEQCVAQFVDRVHREAEQSRAADRETGKPIPVNLLNLSRSLSLDSVSVYLFGRSYGGIHEETGKMSASGFVDAAVAIGRVFYLPNWLFRVFEVLTGVLLPIDKSLEESSRMVDEYANSLSSSSNEDDNTYQGRLLRAGITHHEIAIQCKDLMFAGTDSTGATLSKIMWHLTRQPRMYVFTDAERWAIALTACSFQKLRTEIAQAEEQDVSINPQAIPYLDAVIREGLRLGMANPSRFPRQVPASGFTFTTKTQKSYYLPPGCLVGLQPYSLHLNPEVYDDPLTFRPERWIDDPTPEMQRDWFPFGLGQRQCIARNLAYTELLVTIRAVAKANLLDGAKTVSDRLEILEWFNSKVVGERVDVVWEA